MLCNAIDHMIGEMPIEGVQMNAISRNLKRISVTAIAFVLLISCMLGSTVAYASNTSRPISANIYDLDKDSHYVIGEASPSKSAAIGTLFINGDVRTSSEVNSFSAYEVSNGNASFTYTISSGVLERAEEEWHIIDDKTKKVNPESVKFILFCNQLSKQNRLSITLIAVFFQFPH